MCVDLWNAVNVIYFLLVNVGTHDMENYQTAAAAVAASLPLSLNSSICF